MSFEMPKVIESPSGHFYDNFVKSVNENCSKCISIIKTSSCQIYSLADRANKLADGYFGNGKLIVTSLVCSGLFLIKGGFYPLLSISSLILMNKIATVYEENTEKICKGDATENLTAEQILNASTEEITCPISTDVPVFGREPKEGEYDGKDAFKFGKYYYNRFSLIKALVALGNFPENLIDPLGNQTDLESLETLCNMFGLTSEDFLDLWGKAKAMGRSQLESDAQSDDVLGSETAQVTFLTEGLGQRESEAAVKYRNEFFMELVGVSMGIDSYEYKMLQKLP